MSLHSSFVLIEGDHRRGVERLLAEFGYLFAVVPRTAQSFQSASKTMFRDAAMGVYQLQYMRRRDATPLTRDYMFRDEERLAQKAEATGGAPARYEPGGAAKAN